MVLGEDYFWQNCRWRIYQCCCYWHLRDWSTWWRSDSWYSDFYFGYLGCQCLYLQFYRVHRWKCFTESKSGCQFNQEYSIAHHLEWGGGGWSWRACGLFPSFLLGCERFLTSAYQFWRRNNNSKRVFRKSLSSPKRIFWWCWIKE